MSTAKKAVKKPRAEAEPCPQPYPEEPHPKPCPEELPPLEVSRYEGSTTTLMIGHRTKQYVIPSRVLGQFTKLAPLADVRSHFTDRFLGDVDAEVGHTLVHFLFTGQYQTLGQGLVASEEEERVEYRRSLLALFAGSIYELEGLVEASRRQAESLANAVSFQDIVDVGNEVFGKVGLAREWYLEHVEKHLVGAIEADAETLWQNEFIDGLTDLNFIKAMWKLMAKQFKKLGSEPRLETVDDCVPEDGSLQVRVQQLVDESTDQADKSTEVLELREPPEEHREPERVEVSPEFTPEQPTTPDVTQPAAETISKSTSELVEDPLADVWSFSRKGKGTKGKKQKGSPTTVEVPCEPIPEPPPEPVHEPSGESSSRESKKKRKGITATPLTVPAEPQVAMELESEKETGDDAVCCEGPTVQDAFNYWGVGHKRRVSEEAKPCDPEEILERPCEPDDIPEAPETVLSPAMSAQEEPTGIDRDGGTLERQNSYEIVDAPATELAEDVSVMEKIRSVVSLSDRTMFRMSIHAQHLSNGRWQTCKKCRIRIRRIAEEMELPGDAIPAIVCVAMSTDD